MGDADSTRGSTADGHGDYDIISTDDIDSGGGGCSGAGGSQPAGKMIIPISRAGVMAGTVAASIGYTVANAVMRGTGEASGITVNTVGFLAEKAAGLIAGPGGEIVVGVARRLAAGTVRESILAQAPMTALLVSSVAGAGTCLAVTAGSAAFGLLATAAKKIAAGAVAIVDTYRTRDGAAAAAAQAAENSDHPGHGDDGSS